MNTSYLKKKTDHFEIYRTTAHTLSAEITKNETDLAVEGESDSIAITVVKDKKIGFAYTNNSKNIKQTAEKAIRAASANSRDNDFHGLVQPQKIKKIRTFDDRLLDYSLSDFKKFKKDFLYNVKSASKNIILSSADYSKKIEKVTILNSEGVDLQERYAGNSFSYDLVMKNKGEIATVSGMEIDTKPLTPDFAIRDAKRLLGLANKKPAKTMDCEAVLHPEAMASILHAAFIPNISAENTQQKKSILTGKLNKNIMSDKISITDDATTKGLLATRSFDCEGTPSQRNMIVQNGMLKTFLHNNYTARKDGKKSTGNAARTGTSLSSIGENNIIIEPGTGKDIIREVRRGVYVRELLGVHTMNTLTGEFSLGLHEGSYIEKGKTKHTIKNAMVSGNIYDMLKKVAAVGDKTIHASSGNGAYYLPEIRFEKIKLIGQN